MINDYVEIPDLDPYTTVVSETAPVQLMNVEGKEVLRAYGQRQRLGNYAEIDLKKLLAWVRQHRPDLLSQGSNTTHSPNGI